MADQHVPATDGRRRRSEQSRDRIVGAMLELVEGGAIAPGAEEVAARAKVGLRSVFRHFNDMDTLYREMSVRLARQYEHLLAPYRAADWRGQLAEAIIRRADIHERLIPFRRAADAHRHKSPMLQAQYEGMLLMMRVRLQSILPAALASDVIAIETLDLLLSFPVWQRLRTDQKLPPEQARAVIEAQVDLLLATRAD